MKIVDSGRWRDSAEEGGREGGRERGREGDLRAKIVLLALGVDLLLDHPSFHLSCEESTAVS